MQPFNVSGDGVDRLNELRARLFPLAATLDAIVDEAGDQQQWRQSDEYDGQRVSGVHREQYRAHDQRRDQRDVGQPRRLWTLGRFGRLEDRAHILRIEPG